MVVAPSVASADVSIQATCSRTVRVAGDNLWSAGPVALPSTGSTASSTSCGMAQGANSSAVLLLQRSLKYCYGKNIATDQDFGPATKSALISAQQTEGITADGVYGPQTRDALRWYLDGYCDEAGHPITVV
ncbi:peptidoglycan-binding protein [Micromonospora sp. C31]|uniref:peptidoglycan-binding domain-containing protein n=1 Tax=Micromonospora sp. C31 TaxID=2824876 RepID=UPI001B35E863|nr:peptidoglycan-binding domain-containing protein [Micromonospora sp. C31]MBQ1072487.1 peptidoglycan-binding protein [Micromonospora sp. C31]